MNEAQILDELVPRIDAPADWDDVLRRASRRAPRPRLLVAAAVVVAVIAVAPALAVLLRDQPVRLPDGADQRHLAVVVDPPTGRVLLMVAPWKGHDGFCYFVPAVRAGCVPRTSHGATAAPRQGHGFCYFVPVARAGCVSRTPSGATLLTPPLFGWMFGNRVASGEASTFAGKTVPLIVRHFGGRIDATLFFARGRLLSRLLLRQVVLRDSTGRVVVRVGH